jgi:hypothetical protein
MFEEFSIVENIEIENTENIDVAPKKYDIGDLVWAKDMGNHGLVGLVMSNPTKDEDEMSIYDVYYRGYNGDIIPTREDEIEELIEADRLYYAENNGDLLHYPNIAKKLNITINPKYQQYLDDVQEENL